MLDKLLSFKFLRNLRVWLHDHHPFNAPTTWYAFLKKMGNQIIDNDTSERAASVSYSLILAVFPTIIFFFTLIPYVPIDGLQNQIMRFLKDVLPGDTFSTVGSTILDIISRPRNGVLSLGFVLALYSATSGLVALMQAFNSSSSDDERRGFFAIRGIAVGLTFTLAFALLLAIVVLLIGGVVSDYLLHFGILNNALFINLLTIGRYLLVFAVFTAAVLVIYRYGPNITMHWKHLLPGSVTASVLIVLTTLGFSFYLSNFGSYNKLYGSIGTLIALMIWINLISLLLILGFEMNMALYRSGHAKHMGSSAETTNVTSKTK